MSRYHLRLALACLIGAGVGCTSVPVRYYTLTPRPDNALPASKALLAIDVRVVHIPPQLNRPELMVRIGPTEVTLLENERWASPVNDEIKDALRLELERRFDRMTGSRPAMTKLTLDIDVQHLEAELGRNALLEASWSAVSSDAGQPPSTVRIASCLFRADQEIHNGYAAMVEGYQREIAALADSVVEALTSPASPACRPSATVSQ